MKLHELQRAFRDHVMHGGRAVASQVAPSARVAVEARLAVYAEGYRLRLIEALASNYPRLEQLLGASAFATLARRYIALYPSTYASVRWFGDRLSSEIDRTTEYTDRPWVTELARWEWAIATAFDAADAAPLTMSALSAIEPERWPQLKLTLHPSLQRLELRSNAPALFKALSEDAAPPMPVVNERAQPWLIWREDLRTHFRSMSEAEATAIDTARAGRSFMDVCDALCAFHVASDVPAVVAGWLKSWIVSGLIVAVGV